MSSDGKLLLWAKNITASYPHVEITNLSTSWRDGLGFCALIHHYQPESLDFNSLQIEDKIGNLTKAFEVFEKLGITPVPDPAQILETPDAKVIRPFLLMIYNKLTGRTTSVPGLHKIPRLSLPGGEDNDIKFSSNLQLPPSGGANSIKPDQTFKVILLGDTNVGKTALFERWKNDVFTPTSATIGIELWSRNYSCDGKIIQVQVWDTAGQELYRAITKSYYRQAKGAFLVYDVTNAESFRNISIWSKELLSDIPDNKKIPILLIGNKNDLENERTVSTDEAFLFANKNGFKWIETSAKQGNECQKSFQLLFQDIYKSDIQNSASNSNIDISKDPPVNTPSSCPC